jgi:hypothetical protein
VTVIACARIRTGDGTALVTVTRTVTSTRLEDLRHGTGMWQAIGLSGARRVQSVDFRKFRQVAASRGYS